MNYNYFRYYDPANGRYESNDPLGLEGSFNPSSRLPYPTLRRGERHPARKDHAR
ncbi:MAG: hypothetical protein ACRDJK_11245 [Actinomycetota bacterium]